MNLEPLYGLRVRTPRLELRLPTEPELLELYEVAAAGIHPPEEMPFGVAWTDDLTEESFLAYHHACRESWTADSWKFDLGTWVDGVLAGVQGIGADAYAQQRTIGTGQEIQHAEKDARAEPIHPPHPHLLPPCVASCRIPE